MARWSSRSSHHGAAGKSMWRYGSHAWGTAIDLAFLLAKTAADDGYDLPAVRRLFESVERSALVTYEYRNVVTIASFVQEMRSRWPGVLRKLFHGEHVHAKLVFLTLAIIACARVRALTDLRDNHWSFLVPGRGYRVTTAGLVGFGIRVSAIHDDYAWPDEVFSEAELRSGVEDEDE